MRPSCLIVVLAALGCIGPARRPSPEPLNVLWIVAEDLGPELACFGTPEVRTPALDRLAAEGVLFTRAFAPAAVCSPSRSGFMTGMEPVAIDAHNHRSHRDDGQGLPDGVRLLTDRLRDAGTFTANLVEIDHPLGDGLRGTGKTDWNFRYEGRSFDGRRWSELARNQPFYAQLNLPETHRGGAWETASESLDRPADPARVVFPPYYPDHPVVRADWARYLDAVMVLDRKVGRVLRLLEDSGLADNTVVFFFGDNGRAMVRGKQWPYDSGLRVPLIVRWPRSVPLPEGLVPGRPDDRLVSLLDVHATTLAIRGLPQPAGTHGRVLFGTGRGAPREYVCATRDRTDESVFRMRTARDSRYRYVRNELPERPFLQLNRYKEWSYPVLDLMRRMHAEGRLDPLQATLFAPRMPPEELYDVAADPYETRNLAGDPAHADVLDRLRAALDGWIRDTGADTRGLEPPEVVEAWERRMSATYDERLRERARRRDREDE